MEKQEKKKRSASVTNDELIAETLYDPINQQTSFAIYKDGAITYGDFLETPQGTVLPLDAKNDIVKRGVVLLPSMPVEYGTEKELIGEVQTFIHKYLDVSPTFEHIAAYYVLFTWVFDKFHEVPYLRAIGDFGSGKSRFIQTIGSICYRPIFTGGATTTAPIFRILDELGGTLVLDEADLRVSDMTADIVKILNMGYQKGGSVLRMQGKNFDEVRAFNVFSPKVIATRETFNDKALESRFLVEEMGRGSLRRDIPRNLRDSFYDEARDIRNKLLMWRFRNFHKEISEQDEILEGVHPRLHQIITPLLEIIESDEMKNSLKNFVRGYNSELTADRGLSRESDIVFSICKIQHEENKKEVTVGEIAASINEDIMDFDDRLTPRKIGWYLRSRLQLKAYKTRKGYSLSLTDEKNNEKLEFWKERFGITDADIKGEVVNVVNDVNVVQQQLKMLTAKDVGF